MKTHGSDPKILDYASPGGTKPRRTKPARDEPPKAPALARMLLGVLAVFAWIATLARFAGGIRSTLDVLAIILLALTASLFSVGSIRGY